MTFLLDTSVVIASLDPEEPRHADCDRVLAEGGHKLYVHALAEVFAILTGSRHARRLHPGVAAQLIEESVFPFVELVHLTGREMMQALAECERRGVRGGAIYACCILLPHAKPVCRRCLRWIRATFRLWCGRTIREFKAPEWRRLTLLQA